MTTIVIGFGEPGRILLATAGPSVLRTVETGTTSTMMGPSIREMIMGSSRLTGLHPLRACSRRSATAAFDERVEATTPFNWAHEQWVDLERRYLVRQGDRRATAGRASP
jgi:hypothetical protein